MFNQIKEKDYDALMERTRKRPIPSGRISVRQAYFVFFFSVILGLFFMSLCGLKPLIVSLTALFIYDFVYTPLKRLTSLSLFVGAIVGALPPLAGYLASADKISLEGVMLSIFIYVYQIPHTLSLFYVFGNEWKSAGFKTFAHLPKEKLNIFIISTLVVALFTGNLVILISAGPKFVIPFSIFAIFVLSRALKNIRKLFVDLNLYMLSALLCIIAYKVIINVMRA